MNRGLFLWLHRALCGLLIVCLLAPGCSVPADDNYDTVRNAIASLPLNQARDLARWQSARKAYRYLCVGYIEGKHLVVDQPDDELVTYYCSDALGDIPARVPGQIYKNAVMDVSRAEICNCMDQGQGELVLDPDNPSLFRTFFECMDSRVTDAEEIANQIRDHERLDGGDVDCEPQILFIYVPQSRVQDWEPEEQTPDESTRDLIQEPALPRWVKWLGIGVAIVGGAVVITTLAPKLFPALCALRAEHGNSCPTDPDYAPGQTPQPDQGGAP